MANNPYRPQYLETIESAWGRIVADQVVRRYATAAERDADLGGFTPSELAGQLVSVGAELSFFTGAVWVPIVPVATVSGDIQVTLDAQGFVSVLFPRPFQSKPTLIAGAGSASAGNNPPIWSPFSVSATTFVLRAYDMTTHTNIGAGPMPMSYIATGAPLTGPALTLGRPADLPESWPGTIEDAPPAVAAYLAAVERAASL